MVVLLPYLGIFAMIVLFLLVALGAAGVLQLILRADEVYLWAKSKLWFTPAKPVKVFVQR